MAVEHFCKPENMSFYVVGWLEHNVDPHLDMVLNARCKCGKVRRVGSVNSANILDFLNELEKQNGHK